MSETVKCYRVLRDGMRVGDSVRDFGDFMPEAAEFPTLRSLLNTNALEVVYVEQSVIDEWRVEQDARDKRRAEALAGNDIYDPDEDLDEPIEEEDAEEEEPVTEVKEQVKPKRKVAKKKVTTKKTDKEKGNGKQLSEEAV